MIKGVIADVSGKRAVVLTENGEFITIRNERYAVGQKITYRKPSINKYTSIAACLALVVILSSVGTKLYYTTTSYVDIDINPSMRMELNGFDKVIKVVPLNDDAKEIISTKKISGNIDTCINEVVDISKDKGYINPDNTDVEIIVVSEKTKLVDCVNEVIEKVAASDTELSVKVEEADFDVLKTAMDLNVSVGRLKVLEEYTNEFGGTLKDNAEELATVSNSEIKALKPENDNVVAVITPTEEPDTEITPTAKPEVSENPVYVVVNPTSVPDRIAVKPQFTKTAEPTRAPLTTKAPENVVKPTPEVSELPENTPVVVSTKAPTSVPTVKPTEVPTKKPTEVPTKKPTEVPTAEPTAIPTIKPTPAPTATPTVKPTEVVTPNPTVTPTRKPHDDDEPFWSPWFDWIFGGIFE